jgi:four helix bundle protein
MAWRLCGQLEEMVHAITASGHVLADLDFCKQIRQSSRAAAARIAEGSVRFTAREFALHLRLALGSLAETRAHLERGGRRAYFTLEQQQAASGLLNRATSVTMQLLQSKLRQIGEQEAQKHGTSRKTRRV